MGPLAVLVKLLLEFHERFVLVEVVLETHDLGLAHLIEEVPAF